MFEKKSCSAQTVAANFAAKEAFAKALGTGVRGFALDEISVLRDEQGAPYFVFTGKAKNIVEKSKLKFTLSLSHIKETACAMVIAYS